MIRAITQPQSWSSVPQYRLMVEHSPPVPKTFSNSKSAMVTDDEEEEADVVAAASSALALPETQRRRNTFESGS